MYMMSLFTGSCQVDGPIVKSLRVAERGVDGEGQDDWVSPALPPLAMIKQVPPERYHCLVRLRFYAMLWPALVW